MSVKAQPQFIPTFVPDRRKGTLLAFIATVFWSSTALFIEVLHRDYGMTAVQIAFWRSLIITTGFFVIVRQQDGVAGFKLNKRDFWLLFSNGVLGIALFNVTWNLSVQENGAAVATALVFCSPVFVALGAVPLLGEKVGLLRALAIAVNLFGCALVAGVTAPDVLLKSPAGALLGIGSGLSFAIYTLIGKITGRVSRRSTFSVLFYVFLFGTLAILPVGLATDGLALFRSRWIGQAGFCSLLFHSARPLSAIFCLTPGCGICPPP
jgi:drug/metabolite transporter (DMT)-like permease